MKPMSPQVISDDTDRVLEIVTNRNSSTESFQKALEWAQRGRPRMPEILKGLAGGARRSGYQSTTAPPSRTRPVRLRI